MRKALCLLVLLTFIGCTSQKKTETAAQANAANPKPTTKAGVTDATKPMIIEATQLIQKREFGKAFDKLCGAIKADSKCAAAYFMRAGIFADANQQMRAVTDFSKAIELDPQNAEFRNARGFYLLTRQQLAPAVNDFTQAILLNPKLLMAYNNRGLCYVTLQKFPEAIADFSEAIKLDAKNFDALNNRGFARFRMNEFDTAVADFDAALKLNPDYLNAFNNKGLLLFKTEKFEQAAAQFGEAIKRDRLNAKYYRHRKDAYAKAGRMAEARADQLKINWLQELARVNQIVARGQKEPASWVQRGRLLAEGGEVEAAARDFAVALKLDPKYVLARAGQAGLLLASGETSKALAECDQAEKLANGTVHPELLSIRGDILLKLNRLDEAIACFEEAQRFDAKVAEAYLMRSEKRKAKGEAEGAAADYRQALALDPSLETSRQ